MTDPASPNPGIAPRGVLDVLDTFDADADLETRRRTILTAVQPLGITIPAELAAPRTASIYASLGIEKKFAAAANNGTYGMHMRRIDIEHASFQMALEHGLLPDMVSTPPSSPCWLATSLSGWSFQGSQADEILAILGR